MFAAAKPCNTSEHPVFIQDCHCNGCGTETPEPPETSHTALARTIQWYKDCFVMVYEKSCVMVMKQPHVFLILFVILFFPSVLSMSMWGDLGIWKSPIIQFLYELFAKCFYVDVCWFFVLYKGSMNESSRNTYHVEPDTIGMCFLTCSDGSWIMEVAQHWADQTWPQ